MLAGLVRTQMADNNGYIIPHWLVTGQGDTMEMSGTRECTVHISQDIRNSEKKEGTLLEWRTKSISIALHCIDMG